jgi:hypothetical protein
MTSQAHRAIVVRAGGFGRRTALFLAQAGLKPKMAKVQVRRTRQGLYPMTLVGSSMVGRAGALAGFALAARSPDRGVSRKEPLA